MLDAAATGNITTLLKIVSVQFHRYAVDRYLTIWNRWHFIWSVVGYLWLIYIQDHCIVASRTSPFPWLRSCIRRKERGTCLPLYEKLLDPVTLTHCSRVRMKSPSLKLRLENADSIRDLFSILPPGILPAHKSQVKCYTSLLRTFSSFSLKEHLLLIRVAGWDMNPKTHLPVALHWVATSLAKDVKLWRPGCDLPSKSSLALKELLGRCSLLEVLETLFFTSPMIAKALLIQAHSLN